MNFLPIAERELRVAARRKGTYRVRVGTAAVAGAVMLIFIATIAFFRAPNVGSALFYTLTAYAMGLASLAGLFVTADCLSEEKREGTLGLLFLTDLRGLDVVAGKFLASSLNAIYGLFALFPVLAITLMMGGVTAGEFWRITFLLVNALFLSLAAGMLVSAVCRDAHRAMALTFLVLLAINIVPLLVDGLHGWLAPAAKRHFFAQTSPLHGFYAGRDFGYQQVPMRYWYTIGMVQMQAWVCLALAAWILPRAWQDRVKQKSPAGDSFKLRPATDRGRARRTAARAKLLDQNPVLWLASDHATERWLVWAIVLLNLMIWGAMMWLGFGAEWAAYCPSLTGLLLKALFAIQAGRFFVEARKSGALELLLSTPLTSQQILSGQWQGLRRVFLWPFGVILVQFAFAIPKMGGMWWGELMYASVLLKTVLDPVALGWFGMWFALTSKRPGMATGLTVLLVLVLPKLVICVPDFLIDLVIILVFRRLLHNKARELVMKQVVRGGDEAVVAPAVPAPPVIRRPG